MRAVGFALGLLMLSAPLAVAGKASEWTVSISGGSEIEIPVFFADGDARLLGGFAENFGTAFEPKQYPGVQLRQYRADTTNKRPFEYLEEELVGDTEKVTYKLDKPSFAAISGTSADGTGIFYGMCQKHVIVTCFDMHWDKEEQAMFGPIAERIARSFRKNR
ncbi:exported hypothetical protein [Mesorhizobium metallidurans STM 2683]|uniref:Uncharacterized protein n=1 Tax=Mesorhizobium metallidurans STM 2683 TaxID=1297569 RepID=M5EVN8_9HYPH|nr:hypothetical protein [Mesorhizobium metallidurans]CCV08008.1 exported hypothetical protein [Mesorhizobium metallidurans STM 2683]